MTESQNENNQSGNKPKDRLVVYVAIVLVVLIGVPAAIGFYIKTPEIVPDDIAALCFDADDPSVFYLDKLPECKAYFDKQEEKSKQKFNQLFGWMSNE